MMLNEYQYLAKGTAIFPPVLVPEVDKTTGKCQTTELSLVYPALGYAGEAGEFANKVKKVIRDDFGNLSDEKKEMLADELGDGLWYLAACATALDMSLEEIARNNIAKLQSRKERGVLQGSGDKR